MKTSVVNVKVDPEVKKQAQKVAAELGLSLSAIIKAQLKQLIRTKSVNLSTLEEPTDEAVRALNESLEDVKAGRVVSFDNPDDAVAYLRRITPHEQKTAKN